MARIGLDAYLSRIDTLISENSLEQALYHCFYLLRQFPKFLSVYKQIGRIYFEMNRLPAAASIYSRILSAEPDNFLNHLTMGLILENFQLIDQAIYQTRAALFLQPENKDVIAIYHRLTTHKKGFAEPRHYENLLTGFHAFSAGNYEKALEELSKYQAKEYQTLKLFYQALSMFECNRDDEGIQILENILSRKPWLQTALRKLAVCSNQQNTLRFSEYLHKLTELNPAYAEFSFENNYIHPGKKYPLVIYQEWTGFQNSRLRTVWQQPGSKIIESGIESLPDWLNLIPASDLLYNEEQSGEENNGATVADLLQLFTTDRKRLLPEEDAFFQKDYFQSQIPERTKAIIQPRPVHQDEQPVTILENEPSKGLDDAFDLLEKSPL